MNFFKSILSDEPNPPESESPRDSEPISPTKQSENVAVDADHEISQSSDSTNQNSNTSNSGGLWSFGGLIQTLSTKSGSVLETYRRDLQEFGSGLKKETDMIREVASRAVQDLPASIEVAHGAIDGVIKSTAEIISQGKESFLSQSDVESDNADPSSNLNSRRYSRFDTQLRAIQVDLKTYCEEPEDLGDFNKWKLGFVLEEMGEEIEDLIREDRDLEGIYKRVVPNEVDDDTFWSRYFYRVHKLKQQESVRASLVKRAISIDDEEELSWDVDDEDDDNEQDDNLTLKFDKLGNKDVKSNDLPQIVKDESNGLSKGGKLENEEFGSEDLTQIVEEESKGLPKVEKLDNKELGGEDLSQIAKGESNNEESQIGSSWVDYGKKENELNVGTSNKIADDKEQSQQHISEVKIDQAVLISNDKVVLDGKADSGESCKDSDISVVSSQQSVVEEEDLEWDEIEDDGSSDERKGTHGGSPSRAEVRKRLSAAEEDEDLSWDIEDDDDPAKA